MISDKEIVCPYNLLNVAHKKKDVTAGIVNAGKPLPMISVMDAVNEDLIIPIFIYFWIFFCKITTCLRFSFIYKF